MKRKELKANLLFSGVFLSDAQRSKLIDAKSLYPSLSERKLTFANPLEILRATKNEIKLKRGRRVFPKCIQSPLTSLFICFFRCCFSTSSEILISGWNGKNKNEISYEMQVLRVTSAIYGDLQGGWLTAMHNSRTRSTGNGFKFNSLNEKWGEEKLYFERSRQNYLFFFKSWIQFLFLATFDLSHFLTMWVEKGIFCLCESRIEIID